MNMINLHNMSPATRVPGWWANDYSGAAMALRLTDGRAMVAGYDAALSDLLTCTRATSGWAERLDGTLQEFDANELRITDRGLLFEGSRTNLFLNSFVPVTQTVTVSDATEHTISLKGAGSIALTGAATGTVTDGNPITVTTAGTSLVCTLSGAVTHAQVEVGGFATSFIQTAGSAVTRAADDVDFADLSWHNPVAGTFLIDFEQTPKNSLNDLAEDVGYTFSMGTGNGGNRPHFDLLGHAENEKSRLRWSDTVAPTVAVSYGSEKTRNERHVLAYEAGQPLRGVGAGELIDPISATPYTSTTYNFARIGRRTSAAADYAFCWMRNIVYWPAAKASEELQALALEPSDGNVHFLGDSYIAAPELEAAVRHSMMDEYRVYTSDGVGGTTLAEQKIRFDSTPEYYDRILLIWDGAGDVDTEQEAMDAIDGMVAHLEPGVPWALIEPKPRSGTYIANILTHINSTYGLGHYIPTLAVLQAANDGSPEDLADVAAGKIPGSLMEDENHLNNAGRDVAATGAIRPWLQGLPA